MLGCLRVADTLFVRQERFHASLMLASVVGINTGEGKIAGNTENMEESPSRAFLHTSCGFL